MTKTPSLPSPLPSRLSRLVAGGPLNRAIHVSRCLHTVRSDHHTISYHLKGAVPAPEAKPCRDASGAGSTAPVALYLNRRLRPFTALNSWTGSLFTGSDSWTELHLNRGLPGSAVYDLSTARQRSPRMLRRPRQIKIPLNSAKTDQDRKPQCACQPRTNANMLIGRDAGSTRMASTSALLSDEALLRVDTKMEKGK